MDVLAVVCRSDNNIFTEQKYIRKTSHQIPILLQDQTTVDVFAEEIQAKLVPISINVHR
jgi:hypothetical protein